MTIFFFICARFEVFTAGLPTVALFWDMTPHKWTIGYRSFQLTQCPYRPGRSKFPTEDVLRHFAYWRQGKGRFFETSRSNYPKMQHHTPEEWNPTIPLMLEMGTWIPLCTCKTCSLHSYQYHVSQENSLRWKWKNLDGVQQSCWYSCKHEWFVIDSQQSTTAKHKAYL
jgi:hypothetical protein